MTRTLAPAKRNAAAEGLTPKGTSMAKIRRRVTLKDLAAKAGVSPTAVSYVLNDRLERVRVSEATKQRIKAVAEEMGYVPKLLARAMVTQKSYFIAVICSLPDAPMKPATAIYYANALQGVQEVCKQVGYHCLYASCGLGDPRQFTMPRLMKDGSVDGCITVGHASTEVMRHIKAMGIPCVQVGSNVDPRIGIDVVYPDLNQAFEMLARMLAGLGHRRVEFFTPSGPGPDMHMRHFLSLANTIKGLQPISGMYADEWGDITYGIDHAREWAHRPNRPSAFICSPLLAQGLVSAFESEGLFFPRDYSLAVYLPEESGPLRLGRDAKLVTTATFPIHEVARQAAMKLFNILQVNTDSTIPLMPIVGCRLNEGESCAPPAAQ